ncbi:hypothetical protein YC2023_117152 [Brassica napus]
MAPLPLSCVYAAPQLVGPASSVGEDELSEWRGRYSLPSFITLRVPTSEGRAFIYIPGEIAVYEAFFDSGLMGGGGGDSCADCWFMQPFRDLAF